jgi:hypothetical protein
VVAVVFVILGTIYGVTQAEGEREATRAYLDLAFEVATEEATASGMFVDLILNIDEYTRSTLLERLDVLESDAETMVETLDEADPPKSLLETSQFLRIAAGTWGSGISDVRIGLISLSSNPLDEDGLDALDNGLLDLRVGDSAYAGFVSGLVDVDTTLQGGDPPAVLFIPRETEAFFDASDIARRMFIAGTLAPVDDVAVADLKLEPGPVGERDGLPVIAVTTLQTAEVTISNRGNLEANDISVRLSLVSNEGVLYEAVQQIAVLEAGALTTLVYSELPMSPGVIYELSAVVDRLDDDGTNDLLSFLFMVNPNA